MKRTIVMTLEWADADLPADKVVFVEFPLRKVSCTRAGSCDSCGTRLLLKYIDAPLVGAVYEGLSDEVRCLNCGDIAEVKVSRVHKT